MVVSMTSWTLKDDGNVYSCYSKINDSFEEYKRQHSLKFQNWFPSMLDNKLCKTFSLSYTNHLILHVHWGLKRALEPNSWNNYGSRYIDWTKLLFDRSNMLSQLSHNVEVHVSLYAHNFCMLAHWYGRIVSFLCDSCSKVESLATYFYQFDWPFLLLYWVWEYERLYGNLKLMFGKMEICMIPCMKILHTTYLHKSLFKRLSTN